MRDQKAFSPANTLHQLVIVTLQIKSCDESNLARAAQAVGYLPEGREWFSFLSLGVFVSCCLDSRTGA